MSPGLTAAMKRAAETRKGVQSDDDRADGARVAARVLTGVNEHKPVMGPAAAVVSVLIFGCRPP